MEHLFNAHRAGDGPPEYDDGHRCSGGHHTEQTGTDKPDCAEAAGQRKTLARLRAQFALAGGYVVHEQHDGFLVCWRGLSRQYVGISAPEAFGRLVGAVP